MFMQLKKKIIPVLRVNLPLLWAHLLEYFKFHLYKNHKKLTVYLKAIMDKNMFLELWQLGKTAALYNCSISQCNSFLIILVVPKYSQFSLKPKGICITQTVDLPLSIIICGNPLRKKSHYSDSVDTTLSSSTSLCHKKTHFDVFWSQLTRQLYTSPLIFLFCIFNAYYINWNRL